MSKEKNKSLVKTLEALKKLESETGLYSLISAKSAGYFGEYFGRISVNYEKETVALIPANGGDTILVSPTKSTKIVSEKVNGVVVNKKVKVKGGHVDKFDAYTGVAIALFKYLTGLNYSRYERVYYPYIGIEYEELAKEIATYIGFPEEEFKKIVPTTPIKILNFDLEIVPTVDCGCEDDCCDYCSDYRQADDCEYCEDCENYEEECEDEECNEHIHMFREIPGMPGVVGVMGYCDDESELPSAVQEMLALLKGKC